MAVDSGANAAGDTNFAGLHVPCRVPSLQNGMPTRNELFIQTNQWDMRHHNQNVGTLDGAGQEHSLVWTVVPITHQTRIAQQFFFASNHHMSVVSPTKDASGCRAPFVHDCCHWYGTQTWCATHAWHVCSTMFEGCGQVAIRQRNQPWRKHASAAGLVKNPNPIHMHCSRPVTCGFQFLTL